MDTPQVVKFSNEGVRVSSDKVMTAYTFLKDVCAAYDATGMEALLGNDTTFTDLIVDGSASDGRPQISAGGIKLYIANAKALLQQLEIPQEQTGISFIDGVRSISPRYH